MTHPIRLKLKVWTDPTTHVRYLMPIAVASTKEVFHPQLVMNAYAMRDAEARVIKLTAAEWNRLPFYNFLEDGEVDPADRPKRPFDLFEH